MKPSQGASPTPHMGQTLQVRGIIILHPVEIDPKHSTLNKMKRQGGKQQMKEHGKNPPDQTNEEEIGS